MAAPDMNVSFPGADNGGVDKKALYLKRFAGETLAAFSERNVMASRHVVREIDSGKSAQFPATWKATAGYFTPGSYITGQTIASSERVITIDDLLISSVFISEYDEKMAHYEFRSEYAKQVADALARTLDKNTLQVALLAARASATITGANGGTALTVATALTNADALIGAAFDAAQAFDEKDVPETDRFLFVKPDQYYNLVNSSSKLVHGDYLGGGTNGSVATGKVYSVAGLQIVKTNNLPQGVVNTGPAAYQGTFSNTAALAMQRGAIGTVRLMGLAVESDYLITNQGTLVVAKLAVGHGILRPECSCEIKTA